MIAISGITGLILAGGQGSRMGGADKGLQLLNGIPLVLHAMQRLAPQVGTMAINANRSLTVYESFGAPVWPDGDTLEGYAGPLAGFLAGLVHCPTPWLLTVPCDTPFFPADLALRLAGALPQDGEKLAMASGRDDDGTVRPQPVFCLMHVSLLASLVQYTAGGGRKIGAWTAQQGAAVAAFDREEDDPRSFMNANTLEQLQKLEQCHQAEKSP